MCVCVRASERVHMWMSALLRAEGSDVVREGKGSNSKIELWLG